MGSTEHWQHIETILDAVLDADPGKREAVLQAACGEDTGLRKEVEKLLAACEASADFLEQPAHLEAATLIDAVEASDAAVNHLEAGHRIGAYRILDTIGQGGMGVVYLAERADGTYEQAVALKVVKRGMDTDEVVQRFRHERQILARLEHPHIARLMDGGVTEGDATSSGGLPYFVMEYVEGEPIDTYCAERQCSIRERLTLFVTVCEAVQFAHRNLVVHRDLKPSNILVRPPASVKEPVGEVKLLDFGIAKVLDADDHEVPYTRTQTRRLTPEYAAPEQVMGYLTTPATDVYALGVILYELLTGQRPYVFKSRRMADLEAAICDTVPARPSTAVLRPVPSDATAVPVQQLRRQLSGDLDAIILKALKKEPELRYASAGELLRDVRRYLDGRPVLAQDDTFRYRAGKFIRRNKIGVGAGTLAVLALVIGLVAALWQADRANQEAERARRSFEFLVSTFLNVSPEETQSGTKIDVRAIIDAGEAELATLEGQPLDQAALLDVMGEVAIALNVFDDAIRFYNQSLTLKRTQYGAAHPALVESLHGLAQAVLNETSNYAEAEAYIRQALALVAATREDNRLEERDLYNTLGYVLTVQGQHNDAAQAYRRALQLSNMLLTTEGATLDVQQGWVEGLEGVATAICNHPDSTDQAIGYFQQVIEEKKQVYSATHSEMAKAFSYLAGCLEKKGDEQRAESYHLRALEINKKVYGPTAVPVANGMLTLASLYTRHLNDLPQAEYHYRGAVRIYAEKVDTVHAWRGAALRGLGQLLVDTGRPGEGVPLLRESLDVFEQLGWSPETEFIVKTQYNLGQGYAALGQYDAATPAFETILKLENNARWTVNWKEKAAAGLESLPKGN